MNFCPWYPLALVHAHTPPAPGVFQVRIPRGLIDYPGGKSAMIHYDRADDLHRAAQLFAQAHPGTDWLCRHSVAMSAREQHLGLEAAFALLMEGFVRRFGARPRLPDAGAGPL